MLDLTYLEQSPCKIFETNEHYLVGMVLEKQAESQAVEIPSAIRTRDEGSCSQQTSGY